MKSMTMEEWRDSYLVPMSLLTADDHIDGMVLDAIFDLKYVNGETATDGECLDLALELHEVWKKASSASIEAS